jgi:hypothetical protein
MTNETADRISRIVGRFTAAEPSDFDSLKAHDALRTTIRIALEVGEFLESREVLEVDEALHWTGDTIRSGVDSAWMLWDIYSTATSAVGAIQANFVGTYSQLRDNYEARLSDLQGDHLAGHQRMKTLLELVRLELLLLAATFGTVTPPAGSPQS